MGIFHVLRSALEPRVKRIAVAFGYGSIARHAEKAGSDVDLMIVGKVTLDEVLAELANVEASLGRTVNPTVYSSREYKANLGAVYASALGVRLADEVALTGLWLIASGYRRLCIVWRRVANSAD